jgi:uncharacterized membrane-anchored protein
LNESPIDNLTNRVPEILLSYWIIKIAATTLGETGADHFSHTLGLGYATVSLAFITIFVVLLLRKLSIKKYTPISYWLIFTSTSIAGTAICDFMDRTLGLGYAAGSAILLTLLLGILAIWHHFEKSLNVERIVTSRAEVFYWCAFLVSNTLGTAIGDFLADDLGVGFAGGATIISGLLLVTVLMHYFTKVSTVVVFWLAFVLTRPFGATFGDFLTKPIAEGGANLGTIGSSLFFLLILVILVIREHNGHKKTLAEFGVDESTNIAVEK